MRVLTSITRTTPVLPTPGQSGAKVRGLCERSDRRAAPDPGALFMSLRSQIRGGAAASEFEKIRFFAPLWPGVDMKALGSRNGL